MDRRHCGKAVTNASLGSLSEHATDNSRPMAQLFDPPGLLFILPRAGPCGRRRQVARPRWGHNKQVAVFSVTSVSHGDLTHKLDKQPSADIAEWQISSIVSQMASVYTIYIVLMAPYVKPQEC